MMGAVIGDVAGSQYEFGGEKTKLFPLFTRDSHPTDDSIMTVAVGCACVDADLDDEASFKHEVIKRMKELGRLYPYAGYGGMFYRWIMSDVSKPYYSYGNGSAMRVSPVGWAADSLEEAERLAKWSAEVTHNHPEGIKGAQAVAAAIYLARTGKSKEEIEKYISDNYYSLDFTLDEIRPDYAFDVTCQGSVPQAIKCFLEAVDFEDAVRNAISLGGDADTQACIAGSIAEAYFGIDDELCEEVMEYIDEDLSDYFDHYMEELYGKI